MEADRTGCVCPVDPHTRSIVSACGRGLLRAINNTLENTSVLPPWLPCLLFLGQYRPVFLKIGRTFVCRHAVIHKYQSRGSSVVEGTDPACTGPGFCVQHCKRSFFGRSLLGLQMSWESTAAMTGCCVLFLLLGGISRPRLCI